LKPLAPITPLLEKIAQLTSLHQCEQVSEVFLKFILSEFPELKAAALYKLDLFSKIPALSQEFFFSKDADKTNFDTTEEIFLQNFIPVTIKDSNEFYNFSENNLLIIRAHREKNCIFFIVFLTPGNQLFPQDLCYLPESDLKQLNNSTSLLNLLYYCSIYRNQQNLISLNEKDSLTGLYNRKSFDQKMQAIIENQFSSQHRRAKEGKGYTCLAMLDIDHFKSINDTYGHLYGDEVLLYFAQQMQQIFRKDDLLFRYGGEEFIVLLKDVDDEVAIMVLQRFREHIQNYQFPTVPQITVSIGVTHMKQHHLQSELIDRADLALYYIKEHGRNNVASYEALVSEGLLEAVETKDDIELF
jgi:diguanylate cyclase (GGDEF)-like protein